MVLEKFPFLSISTLLSSRFDDQIICTNEIKFHRIFLLKHNAEKRFIYTNNIKKIVDINEKICT